MATHTVALSAVYAAIEARILAVVEGSSCPDVVQGALPKTSAHKAVIVSAPQTAGNERFGRESAGFKEDSVVIDAFYRLTPNEQKVSRNAAADFEEAILVAVTDFRWGRGVGLTAVDLVDVRRGPHPADAAIWQITQTFTVRRQAALGRAA